MLKFGSANHRQKKINKAKVHSFPKRESFIIFIHFSSVRERESERLRESQREKWNTLREGAPKQPSRERAIRSQVALTTTTRRGERRWAEGRASDPMNLEIFVCCSEWASERSDLKQRRHWKEPVALSLGLDWILVISFFFYTLVISEIRRWNEIL